jgi:hypothetical protein
MFAWAQKTFDEVKKITINTFNTPAPIGKTILITGGLVIGTFLITHKMKVILIFG